MQGPIILVALAPTASETLGVILQLGLHDPTDRDDVATDTCIDHVVADLTVDCLRQFSGIDVLHVVLDLLNPNTLEEGCLGGVFLGVEYAGAAVDVDALVGLLPLAVDEVHLDLGLALVALKLDRLDQHLDARHPQHCPPQTYELVDQVALDHGQGEQLVEVRETCLNNLVEILYFCLL